MTEPKIDEELAALHRDVKAAEGEILLETKELTVKFGGLTALDAVTFDIKRGEILGLIGPNGAGKTTCFNAITGVYRPTFGLRHRSTVRRWERSSATRSPGSGIARTFQNIRLWGEMTALENVVVGTDARHKTSVPGALIRTPRHRREEKSAIEKAAALLQFVGIVPSRRREGQEPAVRRSASARDRQGAGHRTQAAVPRRTGRGVQSEREVGPDRADPRDPRRRLHGAADRTRHATGYGRYRPDRGARVRPQDRRRTACRHPRGPEGHRRIFGGAR